MECFRMGPEHATNKIVVRTCNGIEVSSSYHETCIKEYIGTRCGRVVTMVSSRLQVEALVKAHPT